MTADTIILGGGLAGISAATHLRGDYRLLEREDELGGLARTEEREGFFFDRTGHWLHLRDSDVRQEITGLLGDSLKEVERRAEIFSHGKLTRYPFQGNLFGLPPEVNYACLRGAIKAHYERPDQEPQDFEQYILHHFGEGIARHFMIPYNQKLWGVHPKEITSAWCERFVPRPSIDQIIAGAVGAGPAELGYNVRFLYPERGGIGALSQALAASIDDRRATLGAAVEAIDTKAQAVTVNGERLGYRALISSIPLPALIGLLVDAPDQIRLAASKLRATAVSYLNVAARRKPPADFHWIYLPEPRLPFYRVGVYSNVMPSMAPAGCASYYVELADRAIGDERALIKGCLEGLVECRALHSVDEVIFAELRTIDPAYVIFDQAYQGALATLHPYLEQQRIFSIGRYGEWIYNAMEDSLLAGKRAAERVNALCGDRRKV